MSKQFDERSPPDATEASTADGMDIGLLHRGDGMLPTVGLGGSAGSIAALQAFFAAMPADSGMAFVVILHLSPTHVSTLAELLQRATAMPVVPATDGVTLEPNSVYVIPPGKFLAAAQEHLMLSDAQEPRGKRVAIDHFFRTLAETHGAQALAVVLSGAGGDGALGLKRIKELGGLTIVQDPDEAEHSDMPRAAIATGVVDWVLGVNEMPARLLTYVQQRRELALPAEDGPHPTAMAPIGDEGEKGEFALRDVLSFLHTRTGRDFSYYKRATIVRRIARRMHVNGLADLPGYLAYLRTHTGEAGALLQDLLISVTNFFRDPAAFAALQRTIPAMFEGKDGGDTIRVWVAGCATGEEAYSIAILLCEHANTLVGPPQIQVFATDLDEDVIREAREGRYPESIGADVSPERLKHFFIHQKDGYRVRRAVRELVLFAPHDLLKDSPFSRLDLVSCRNLLIYLNREAQSRAFDIFHFALRPGGKLFLGTSEAVDEGGPLFAVLDKKQRIYVQRPGPRRLIAVPTGPGTLARALALQERSRERIAIPGQVHVENPDPTVAPAMGFNSALPPAELHYRLLERFSPPSILVNAGHDIVHLSESASRFLQITGGEPTRNLLRMVHPMLRVELRAALYAAAMTHTAATAFRIPVETRDARSLVDIRVTPAGETAPDYLLVVFEEHPADEAAANAAPRSADADQAAMHLERELVATKGHLRETIEESEASTEELKASNEELQAMNEELRSATEELETGREELQSINEELTTVNEELKSNVDQLARSNNDLQNLMAATDIATVFLDRQLRINRFTPAAKTLFSFIATDVGRPLSDLSRQIEYPDIVADAERSLAQLQPAQREVGTGERQYIARILPYRTSDDHIAGVVLTFTDITAIKQGEAATGRLAAIVESSGDAIIGKDLHGIITSWNGGAEAMFGYAAAEMIGQSGARIIPSQRTTEEFELLARARSGETIKGFETLRVRRDGTTIPISATISPIKDSAGRIIGTSKSARDISDAKRAEAELRESEERLAFVRRSSGVGFWYCDLPFDVLQWDDQVKAHFHLTPDADVTIQTFYERIHPDDREPTREAIDQSIAQRNSYRQDYRTVNPETGAVKWVRAMGRTFYGTDGAPIRFDGVTLDVSDQKRAEARLRDADRRKDEFLATLAHELRNPLAPILNGLQVIRLAGMTGPVMQARVMMERQLAQMVRLVDDLLDMNRLTTGKVTIEPAYIALRGVIDAALETSRPAIEQAGQGLSVTIPEDPITVKGDLMRLAQVISNLLTNAAKYTPRGGLIRVSVERKDDMAEITVADNGIGIPRDMLDEVFEMFTQVDRALEKTTGGLGIGLSLVKGLVAMHGGTIEAQSEGEGRGSTFVVRLPVVLAAVETVVPVTQEEPAGMASGLRILIADDNLDAADSLRQLLEMLGNEVSAASDGLTAVELAQVFRPDVILLDIGMPKLNGYEAARRIRGAPWGRHAVLVALTGWGEDDARRRSADAGFNHHLVKPLAFETLEKLLTGLQIKAKS